MGNYARKRNQRLCQENIKEYHEGFRKERMEKVATSRAGIARKVTWTKARRYERIVVITRQKTR